jgi:hypothetical protein
MGYECTGRLAGLVVVRGGIAMDHTDILNVVKETGEYQMQQIILNLQLWISYMNYMSK